MSNVLAGKAKVKQAVMGAMFSYSPLLPLLTGSPDEDISTMSFREKREAFQKKVKSHLFIDDTLSDPGCFIFFDVEAPRIEPRTKTMRVILYAIADRGTLDDIDIAGYMGNKADILAQMVEEAILSPENIKDFGIGNIDLDAVSIYNSKGYYGSCMIFEVHDFN